jgi:flagellar biosynthesis GTPase FlhF
MSLNIKILLLYDTLICRPFAIQILQNSMFCFENGEQQYFGQHLPGVPEGSTVYSWKQCVAALGDLNIHISTQQAEAAAGFMSILNLLNTSASIPSNLTPLQYFQKQRRVASTKYHPDRYVRQKQQLQQQQEQEKQQLQQQQEQEKQQLQEQEQLQAKQQQEQEQLQAKQLQAKQQQEQEQLQAKQLQEQEQLLLQGSCDDSTMQKLNNTFDIIIGFIQVRLAALRLLAHHPTTLLTAYHAAYARHLRFMLSHHITPHTAPNDPPTPPFLPLQSFSE